LSLVDGHRHTFTLNAAGRGATDSEAGHWHLITRDPIPQLHFAKTVVGDATRIEVGMSQPMDPVVGAKTATYALSGGLQVLSVDFKEDCRRATLVASGKAATGETTVAVDANWKSRIGRALEGETSVVVGDAAVFAKPSDYEVGGPRDMFRARAPTYGSLRFLDDKGRGQSRGISVGDVWAYRSYIVGASEAAAIWTFDGVDESRFGDTLPLELTVRVFRTHKGSLNRTVRGTVQLRNPKNPALATRPRQFYAKDASIDQQYFGRKQLGVDPSGAVVELDLYDDLAEEGRVEVVVQCSESGQCFGMARADAYLLAREGSFEWNFVKATFSTWLQMIVVIAVGVAASTILSGPVALMATLSYCVFGFFSEFAEKIAAGKTYGGGPFESAYRLEYQWNLVREMDEGGTRTFIHMADDLARWMLQAIVHMAADLGAFNRVDYLASGFDVPLAHLALLTPMALAYVAPTLLLGCILLKSREVAL
jgi:hypothetical protein